jgi:hypothetical protein
MSDWAARRILSRGIRKQEMRTQMVNITVQKWVIDGLIGWATVAVLTLVVSTATRAPYSFFANLGYALFVGLFIGTPGGILMGRIRDGWIWPVAGGLLSAGVVGLIVLLLNVI